MINMNQRASKREAILAVLPRFYCATAFNGYRKQFELAKRWAKRDIAIELSKLSGNLMAATRKARGHQGGVRGEVMQEKPAWKQWNDRAGLLVVVVNESTPEHQHGRSREPSRRKSALDGSHRRG